MFLALGGSTGWGSPCIFFSHAGAKVGKRGRAKEAAMALEATL